MTRDLMHSISLIIAMYKRGPAIRPTLDSVLSQSQIPNEILVVDDGSQDGSAEWIESHYPSVRVLRKPNGGTSSARNVGANAAIGEYLVFLDHDDLLLPDAIKTLASLFQEFPEAASVHADHVYDNIAEGIRYENHHHTIPSFGRLMDTPVLRQTKTGRLYGHTLYRSLLRGNLLQQPFAIRSHAFQSIGGYSEDVRYCEDWDLYLRISQKFPVAVSDDVISIHVVEGNNLHLTKAELQEEMYQRVLNRRLKSQPMWSFRENSIIRKKLGLICKTAADRSWASGDKHGSWKQCVRSACWWPFDYVVVSRALLRGLPVLLQR